LATMSEVDLPVDTVRDQINTAVDIVVQLTRAPDGARRVTEVCALTSTRRQPYVVHPISRFDADPLGPDRISRGRFVHGPLPRDMHRRLVAAGEALPAVWARGIGDNDNRRHESDGNDADGRLRRHDSDAMTPTP
ncbi:MAG: hypothetical protein ACRC35_12145, partial [Angustibacter sp.]